MAHSITNPSAAPLPDDRGSDLMLHGYGPSGSMPMPDDKAARPVLTAAEKQARLLLLAGQMLKFGAVGGLGFVWDTATVYALRPFIGFTAAALSAYFIAASMNWILNRLWTFRGRGHHQGLFHQWLRFLGANGFGFVLNRSVVFALAWSFPVCLAYPVMALAAGSLAGMGTNFTLSRRLVFR